MQWYDIAGKMERQAVSQILCTLKEGSHFFPVRLAIQGSKEGVAEVKNCKCVHFHKRL